MDILGSTTPSSLVASVASGVQITGADIWPILAIVGVPIAFVIYRYVVGATKESVGAPVESGYYHGGKDGMTRDVDQKLGEMEYDVQEYGMWPKPPDKS